MTIVPVVLSGGAGTRLWPLSRPSYPKQFIALQGEESLLTRSCRRVADPARFAPPLLVCNLEHRFLVGEHAQKAGRTPAAILLEPVGRNTAPAVAAAALWTARGDPDALLLVLPCDHWIEDEQAFLGAVERAAQAARTTGRLMTFGIAPERPETGFGYIEPGKALQPAGAIVEAFHEKPDERTAERYLSRGYLWNSGMFLLPVPTLLEEFAAHAPAVLDAAEGAIAGAREDLDFLRLDEDAFAAAPSISFDHAVMEHTRRAGVLPCSIGWSDLGSWEALGRLVEPDDQGNRLEGEAIAWNSSGCQIRSDGPFVAAMGLSDLLIVAQDDAVLVAPKSQADRVKDLLAALRESAIEQALGGREVHRPWGWYRNLEGGAGYLVKLIEVKPGGRLSLQRHAHRAEHWIVVEGRARVTRGADVLELEANQSTYIPLGTPHRLENPGTEPLRMIEVQSGNWISEEDIERLEDIYGRGVGTSS